MAISRSLLSIRYGDVSITASALGLTWQVYHAATSTVIESGYVSVMLRTPMAIDEAWVQALKQVNSVTAAVFDKHVAISAIGNHSAFDADLILDGWLSDTVSMKIVHPLSGTFSSVTYNGVAGLVNAILARVLAPPMWAWAEPVTDGLRVKCIAVPGATSYNVYSGTTLLGSVPNANWNTLTVDDGSYSVRVAPVTGGVVGICSAPVAVQVGASGPSLLLEDPLRMVDTSADAEMPAKQTLGQKLKRLPGRIVRGEL